MDMADTAVTAVMAGMVMVVMAGMVMADMVTAVMAITVVMVMAVMAITATEGTATGTMEIGTMVMGTATGTMEIGTMVMGTATVGGGAGVGMDMGSERAGPGRPMATDGFATKGSNN